MKKIIQFVLILLFSLFFLSCKKDESLEEKEIIIELLNNFDIKNTNGFTYTLEQKLNDIVVNKHFISVKLKITNSSIIGFRTETKKELNEDFSDSQYTEINTTAYFNNDIIATYENNTWVWNYCKFDDFILINPNFFNFNINKINVEKIYGFTTYKKIYFKIDNPQTLGLSENVKDLNIEITVSYDLKKLYRFGMSYSQKLTTTNFIFTPCYENVDIELPQ